jgi:hypothetical protein
VQPRKFDLQVPLLRTRSKPEATPRAMPALQLGVGVNRILDGRAEVGEVELMMLQQAREDLTVAGLTPRVAALVVQAALYGEVRYR